MNIETPTKVKFCGLRTPQNLQAALTLGADYLGMIFVPGSKRCVDIEEVASFWSQTGRGSAKRVGVFQGQSACEINRIVLKCDLDFVQLHGHEVRDFPSGIRVPVIRLIRVPATDAKQLNQEMQPQAAPAAQSNIRRALPMNLHAVLLDAENAAGQSGGLGLESDPRGLTSVLDSLQPGTRVFLSGGLTPDNVARYVAKYHPYAVDVSSGIEFLDRDESTKDLEKMQAFMRALGRLKS